MKCYINITAQDALRARGDALGLQAVEVDLGKLTEQQLAALQTNSRPMKDGIQITLLGCGLATEEAIIALLDREIECRKKNEQDAAAKLARLEAELRTALKERRTTTQEHNYYAADQVLTWVKLSADMPWLAAKDREAMPGDLMAELDKWLAEIDARNEAAEKAMTQQAEALKAARAVKAAAAEAEKAEWIRAHGSRRLKTMLAEGISYKGVYLDERLAAERPGWQYQADVGGTIDEPRNIPESAVDLLQEARKTDPAAKLAYWVEDGDDELEGEKPAREYVAVSSFLGEPTVFFARKE